MIRAGTSSDIISASDGRPGTPIMRTQRPISGVVLRDRFTGGRSKAGPCGRNAGPGRLSESSEQSGDWAAECNWSTGLGVLFQSTVQLSAIGLD